MTMKSSMTTFAKRGKFLPPDLEQINESRADLAEAALLAFQQITGAESEDALSDLLADLMHWCDQNGQDFEVELNRAQCRFDFETDV